jgi:D-3-phosphoglycerate dehydrogenase
VSPIGLDELLHQADFVSLHAPLTECTLHIIGREQLKCMKPDAILINTARGGLVDEIALVEALSKKWIGGAGIDVYESLPMFEARPACFHHPLFELENVLLTPHSAGTSVESLEQLMLDGAREAIRVLSGHAPHNWVNPTVIPRAPLHSAEIPQ